MSHEVSLRVTDVIKYSTSTLPVKYKGFYSHNEAKPPTFASKNDQRMESKKLIARSCILAMICSAVVTSLLLLQYVFCHPRN